jgi:hypothetical protein
LAVFSLSLSLHFGPFLLSSVLPALSSLLLLSIMIIMLFFFFFFFSFSQFFLLIRVSDMQVVENFIVVAIGRGFGVVRSYYRLRFIKKTSILKTTKIFIVHVCLFVLTKQQGKLSPILCFQPLSVPLFVMHDSSFIRMYFSSCFVCICSV